MSMNQGAGKGLAFQKLRLQAMAWLVIGRSERADGRPPLFGSLGALVLAPSESLIVGAVTAPPGTADVG